MAGTSNYLAALGGNCAEANVRRNRRARRKDSAEELPLPEGMLAGSLGREVRDEVSQFSIGGVGRIVLALHGQGAVELPGYGLPEASARRIRPSAASTPSDATPAATKKASL